MVVKKLKETKTDLIIHPVRIRILLAIEGQKMTTQELSERLKDIPQATLYRHLSKLNKGGIIKVVEERQVRGTLEKVYAVPDNNADLNFQDLQDSSDEDNIRYFTHFVATLIGDFGRYIRKGKPNYEADGLSYKQVSLNLTDHELKEMVEKIQNILEDYNSNSPSEERHRKTYTTIIIPD